MDAVIMEARKQLIKESNNNNESEYVNLDMDYKIETLPDLFSIHKEENKPDKQVDDEQLEDPYLTMK